MLRIFSKPVSLLVLSGVVVGGPIWWHFYRPNLVALAADDQSPQGAPIDAGPVGTEPSSGRALEVAMIRAGVDVKALAAVGVTSNSIAAIAASASQHMAQHASSFSLTDTAFANARRESDRLLRLIQSGKATQQEVAAYQVQKSALEAATAQRQARLDAIFDACTVGLSPEKKATMRRIRLNKSWSLPTEYLTVDRSEQEWVDLRSALANERISLASNTEPDPEWQARLAVWRADPAVASAKANLDANLVTVTAALAQATHD